MDHHLNTEGMVHLNIQDTDHLKAEVMNHLRTLEDSIDSITPETPDSTRLSTLAFPESQLR